MLVSCCMIGLLPYALLRNSCSIVFAVGVLPPQRIQFSVDNVRVAKLMGAGVYSSKSVNGMVFLRECESMWALICIKKIMQIVEFISGRASSNRFLIQVLRKAFVKNVIR